MIDPLEPACAATIVQLRRVVLRISLMSHAPTQSYDVVMKGDDVPNAPPRWRMNDRRAPVPHMGAHSAKGGDTLIPRGDVPRQDDKEADFRQKSHLYFERKLNRIVRYGRSTSADLDALLEEATQALEDWRRTPAVAGVEPERGSYFWRCAIADAGGSSLSDQELTAIKSKYTVSKATIYRYRKQLRGIRKRSAA